MGSYAQYYFDNSLAAQMTARDLRGRTHVAFVCLFVFFSYVVRVPTNEFAGPSSTPR